MIEQDTAKNNDIKYKNVDLEMKKCPNCGMDLAEMGFIDEILAKYCQFCRWISDPTARPIIDAFHNIRDDVDCLHYFLREVPTYEKKIHMARSVVPFDPICGQCKNGVCKLNNMKMTNKKSEVTCERCLDIIHRGRQIKAMKSRRRSEKIK